ncbi:hypothetical protein F5B20DRAFT_564485 [Whalleya microplaca]|nr:hypothetical protein F5B20DRAFT_564485 [Whalleya microplaca]
MPPQTRSRGKASAGVTFKSTAAAPQQQLFPPRRRQVKTYGRSRTSREMKQSTLTQMDFVPPSMQEDLLNTEDEEEDANRVEEVKSKKKARGTRRKTTGDDLDANEKPRASKRRKTLGDSPNVNVTSSFHTQTLTQFLSNKDEDEKIWEISESGDDDEQGFILETPTKDKSARTPQISDPKGVEQENPPRSSVPSLYNSSTPQNRKTKTVIPSSNTPLTPMLMRYSPAPHDSPLKNKSTNISAPSPIIKTILKTPRDRVIQDSYSSSHSSPATPTPKSTVNITPGKKLRFELPEDKENITPGRTKPKSPKPAKKSSGRPPLREIPDSDEDFDETEGETEDEESSEAFDEEQDAPVEHDDTVLTSPDPGTAPETCYDDIGEETQAELLSSAEGLSREIEADGPPETAPADAGAPTSPTSEHGDVAQTTRDRDVTPPPSASVVEQTPISSPQAEPTYENMTMTQAQSLTQGLESQRLPLEAIHALGPQTPNSDIMVSLHPEPLAKILDRTKNHEFRTWKIPASVSRVWIYSTRPFCELKHMCMLGPAKVPGEIQKEDGIGNAEFNQGKGVMKFAYEILQVYELNNPVSLDEMKQKGWIGAAPQKYTWIAPAVVGELTANLRCALFADPESPLLGGKPNVTESQELRAQLQSDLDFSTQHQSSQNADEVVPASQSPRRSTDRRLQSGDIRNFVKPAAPRLRSGSSVQALPAAPIPRSQGGVRPSQATTVSQVSSSPQLSPVKSLPRAITISSEVSNHELHSSSPTAFRHTRHSLRSSQFPTRSQMLPDSLLNDDIQEPPPIIWDSADEQSD